MLTTDLMLKNTLDRLCVHHIKHQTHTALPRFLEDSIPSTTVRQAVWTILTEEGTVRSLRRRLSKTYIPQIVNVSTHIQAYMVATCNNVQTFFSRTTIRSGGGGGGGGGVMERFP